jgi:hypothetical protein
VSEDVCVEVPVEVSVAVVLPQAAKARSIMAARRKQRIFFARFIFVLLRFYFYHCPAVTNYINKMHMPGILLQFFENLLIIG